ncbi:hypothetical protein CHS0354_020743 [Potamilus streckersoni]|uniref:Asl1-like glycosyl hydrolase catalytic domain-containing protein n=1 Tax=Potamilus streckersoni TaxID=2493646 RepID=A0AAE0SCY5_9BIVA|nr:hypothetical protein CHS0354_020743 [Potamilus streckersoni]
MAAFALLIVVVVFLQGALGSGKKGLAVSNSHYRCGDLDPFNNVHWWYDWSETPFYHTHQQCGPLKTGRVAMVWGWRLHADLPLHIAHDSEYVLGFNEPNFYKQANITPQAAVQHWAEIEAHSHGKPLVSPAAAPCSAHDSCMSNGEEWLAEFFQLCKNCRIDFIATHAYWCNPDSTMNYLKRLWDHFHKPIWLTEFSCPQTHSEDRQLQYMKEILPRLEAAHFVFRYSWYVHRKMTNGWTTTSTSLLHQHNSNLTTLGEYYNNF